MTAHNKSKPAALGCELVLVCPAVQHVRHRDAHLFCPHSTPVAYPCGKTAFSCLSLLVKQAFLWMGLWLHASSGSVGAAVEACGKCILNVACEFTLWRDPASISEMWLKGKNI
jgi:hypothetical protein